MDIHDKSEIFTHAKPNTIAITDYTIWLKHITGDGALSAQLADLEAGAIVELEVDGVQGLWEKMRDGKNGVPTMGYKPTGDIRELWHDWFKSRRGEVVSIRLISQAGMGHTALAMVQDGMPDETRKAAWAALLDLSARGWRSKPADISRDDLHERG